MTALRAVLIGLAACSLLAGTAQADIDELPDFGSSADLTLSESQERAIGRTVVRRLRESGLLLDDPETLAYVQDVGQQLAAHSTDGGRHFDFFVVNDDSVNAFALPGGFIGINAGLILATTSESELAAVIAHEIAHVTQKHINRQIENSSRDALVSAAAMLAAVIVGAATDSTDAAAAGVTAAQSWQAQRQVNFTRKHEYEADRIGIGILADAGFDPDAMPRFFETMSRLTRGPGNSIPEFLLTHPVSADRIAESRGRVKDHESKLVEDTVEYSIVRARLRISQTDTSAEALDIFEEENFSKIETEYGRALALLQARRYRESTKLFRKLVRRDEGTIAYHVGLGQSLLASDKVAEALQVFDEALELFPRNIPLTIRYSQELMQLGNAERAHDLMLDLLNNSTPTPEQVRLLAKAAGNAGLLAEAHYYMSEYHVLNGELTMAIDQLEIALFTPGINDYQKARFESRIEFLREYLPGKKKRNRNDRAG